MAVCASRSEAYLHKRNVQVEMRAVCLYVHGFRPDSHDELVDIATKARVKHLLSHPAQRLGNMTQIYNDSDNDSCTRRAVRVATSRRCPTLTALCRLGRDPAALSPAAAATRK